MIVDGVMLPFVMRSSDGAPFDTSVRRFTTIRYNVDVDESLFNQPAGQVPRPEPQAGLFEWRQRRVLEDVPAEFTARRAR